MIRSFILRKLIHQYSQGLFCVPCRKPTHRTLNWKTDTCCQSGRMLISENTRTSSMNGNFTHAVVITNNNILQEHQSELRTFEMYKSLVTPCFGRSRSTLARNKGRHALVSRWRNAVNVDGDYAEK
jgi:hypothetical protein